MTRLPRITGKRLIAALTKAGFVLIRICGSHHFLQHPEGRGTVVPVHSGEVIGPGLLNKILKDAELSRQDFESLLRG
jgi:predicted RNA binding protein YcfA (HicA-like mRNA interferase family)